MMGVATGMFLFATIETMQNSLKDATVASANDTTMIVYRENRFVLQQVGCRNITKRFKRLRS